MQDRDSGSLRLVNLMRLLRDEGAHVVFLPSDLKHADAYTQALQALGIERSEEHTSELQSLMRISYAVFCLKKKKNIHNNALSNLVLCRTTLIHYHLHKI